MRRGEIITTNPSKNYRILKLISPFLGVYFPVNAYNNKSTLERSKYIANKTKTAKEPVLDLFGHYNNKEEKTWYITKNGENYLKCCGSESEAKNIVELLSKDVSRINKEK